MLSKSGPQSDEAPTSIVGKSAVADQTRKRTRINQSPPTAASTRFKVQGYMVPLGLAASWGGWLAPDGAQHPGRAPFPGAPLSSTPPQRLAPSKPLKTCTSAPLIAELAPQAAGQWNERVAKTAGPQPRANAANQARKPQPPEAPQQKASRASRSQTGVHRACK